MGTRRPTRPWEGNSLRIDADILLALLAYGAASLSDYLFTFIGLAAGEIRELNPLINSYIDHFGLAYGLALPKLILGIPVIVATSLFLHAMYRQRRTRFRVQYILYPGALFTSVAPMHWLVLKHLG